MKRRPINLNFLTIHFPVTAWVSIAHRLSGVFLFLCLPLMLWMLQESLASEQRLLQLKLTLQTPISQGILWLLLIALLYHWIAGIRHLLLDAHVGETKEGGKIGAWLIICISLVLFVTAGYWIWLK